MKGFTEEHLSNAQFGRNKASVVFNRPNKFSENVFATSVL